MVTIDSKSKICTLINVFTVAPEKSDELFNLLKEATEKVMYKLPGYISANLHVSDDKKTITNYAQWRAIEDFKSMLQNDEAKTHMQKAAGLAEKFEPKTYHFIWQHSNG